MFDIGWSEMMVLAIVAVVIVGPKDLPRVIRTVGQWVGKARSMAREFQSSLDDIAREAELDELKKQANTITSEFEKATREVTDDLDVSGELERSIDPTGTLDKVFDPADTSADAAGDVTVPAPETVEVERPAIAAVSGAAEADDGEADVSPAIAAPKTGT